MRGALRAALIAAAFLAGPSRAAPPNDDCTQATVIPSLPFTTTLDTSTATLAADDPGLPCLSDFDRGDQTVWFRYTAADDVVLAVSTAGSDYDTTLAVHPDACGALGPFLALACNDDDLLGLQSRLFVALDQGQTVLIEVTGFGSLTLDVRHAPEGHPGSHGPEFQVNTYTTSDQGYYFFPHSHAMCAAADGDFVIVWESQGGYFPTGQDGSMAGVFGQRYAADGAPQGGEFQVNQATTGDQYYPSIGCAPDGEFVVAWRNGSYTPASGISARRFDAAGAPTTGDIPVTVMLGGTWSSVGLDPAGNFVVLTHEGGNINARKYDAAGVLLGPAFEVNEPTLDGLYRPDLAVNATGDFVVVWENSDDGQIHGRRLDASATPVGSDFPVSLDGGTQAAVSITPSGGFVVTWNGDDPLGYKGIQARAFDAGGTPGPVFTVNDVDEENVVTADVATDEDGNFVVVWEDYYYADSVLARRFLADGTPVGDVEFAVPTVREYYQHAPHVAAQPGGDFVVAWVGYDGYDEDEGYFTGGYGVKAQRFRIAPPPPCPPAPRAGCKQQTLAGKGQLQLRDNSPDTADNVSWKWVKGDAFTEAEIGYPFVTDGFAFCVYDAANGLVMEGVVPPGGTCGTKSCWKSVGNTVWKFVDKAGTRAAGIRKLVLKAGIQGATKMILKGKGDGLMMPGLPLTLPVRAQLASGTGTCWEAQFEASGVLDNTSAEFHARAHVD